MSAEKRAWLYRIVTAVGALAVFYGLISGDALPLWLGLASTLLGSGTAAAYTPRHRAAADADDR